MWNGNKNDLPTTYKINCGFWLNQRSLRVCYVWFSFGKSSHTNPQLILYKHVTTHLNATLKIALKIIGLIILLIFLYFIESIIFWLILGEGGQASSIMNKWSTQFIFYVLPLIIILGIGYKIFKKRINWTDWKKEF